MGELKRRLQHAPLPGCSSAARVRSQSFTAAAQHGLHLTVTHKPFRAATASPELQSRSASVVVILTLLTPQTCCQVLRRTRSPSSLWS